MTPEYTPAKISDAALEALHPFTDPTPPPASGATVPSVEELDKAYHNGSAISTLFIHHKEGLARVREAMLQAKVSVCGYHADSADCDARNLERTLEQTERERDELQRTFDFRHKADMRAIHQWRSKGGDELTWPDHADLCVWLMEQLRLQKRHTADANRGAEFNARVNHLVTAKNSSLRAEVEAWKAEIDKIKRHTGAPSLQEAFDVLIRTKAHDEDVIESQFNKIKEQAAELAKRQWVNWSERKPTAEDGMQILFRYGRLCYVNSYHHKPRNEENNPHFWMPIPPTQEPATVETCPTCGSADKSVRESMSKPNCGPPLFPCQNAWHTPDPLAEVRAHHAKGGRVEVKRIASTFWTNLLQREAHLFSDPALQFRIHPDDIAPAPASPPKVEMPKIKTRFINPPIPIRNFDWEATRDGYDKGDPIGFGRTEELAKADLLEQEEAR